MEAKEKRIWLLYGLDFLTCLSIVPLYFLLILEKVIELEKFIFLLYCCKEFFIILLSKIE